MVHRRNFDIQLYEQAQSNMTNLKMDLMETMNHLVINRLNSGKSVKEIEIDTMELMKYNLRRNLCVNILSIFI